MAEPVVREFKNPFTGELTRVSSREPDWSDDAGEDAFKPDYKVVAIQGDYRAYLEGRLGPRIRALPHWCAKGLTEVELAPLGEAARIETVLEPALFAAPSLGAMLDEINPDLVLHLATADEDALQAIAARWAAAMSTRDHTHSVTGEKLNDGWSTTEALSILRPLVALMRQASSGQKLYLLTEV